MRLFSLLLLLALVGCMSGRSRMLVDMNGRKVQFEAFEAGKVPRDVEVSHFDTRNLHVQGETPIEVNGIPVLVQGDEVAIGPRKIIVDSDAAILVRKDGQIEVRVPSTAPAPKPAAQ